MGGSMTSFALDVRTMMWLLFFGNLLIGGIFSIRDRENQRDENVRRFTLGKFAQAIAWGLIVLRGDIPDPLSVVAGNALLLVGFLLEVFAIIAASGANVRVEPFLIVVNVLGAVAFWVFYEVPSARIQVVSIVGSVIFGTTSWAILRTRKQSRLHLGIGLAYGILAMTLVFRAGFAAFGPVGMELLTRNLAQTLSLLSCFLLLLLGGVGFLLQTKEKSDRQLRDVHRELTIREALINNVFNTSSVAIFLLDKDGVITLANRRMGEMFRCPSESLIGRRYVDFLSAEDRDSALCGMRSVLEERVSIHKVERLYCRMDGACFWGQLTGARMHDTHRDEHQLVAVISDISELKMAEQKILEMAQHDPLTGLANRALFSDRIQQVLIAAQRDHSKFAILFIDLDHFKPVNDQFGHAVGDLLLKKVAQRIMANVRESDTVARIGGDEFVVLLRGAETNEGALGVADKIRRSIASPFDVEDKRLVISCCIGIALYPDHGQTEIELSKYADGAMYSAKRESRDRERLVPFVS